MNTSSLFLLALYILTLLASGDARRRRSRPNRVPTELRRFNINFLRGRFAFGPTTNTELRCQNTFFNPILPSTLQVASDSINNAGEQTMPSADAIATFEQVGRTGLFNMGDVQVRIIARGPVVRGRYVFIVFFNGEVISTEISNVRLFNRFFRRRVNNFIRSFGLGGPRNLLRNRQCRRMLAREFMFPVVTPAPDDPMEDPTPEPTPAPEDMEQDMGPDAQPDPTPEPTPVAEADPGTAEVAE